MVAEERRNGDHAEGCPRRYVAGDKVAEMGVPPEHFFLRLNDEAADIPGGDLQQDVADDSGND